MTRGRALGPGTLKKAGRSWVFAWTDELGTRRRKSLSTNRQAAERIRVEILQRRDMAIAGLGSEAGQDLGLDEVFHMYLEDLAPRVSPRHARQVRSRLEKALADLGPLRIRDLRPMHVIRLRNEATRAGLGNRTANLIVTTLKAMLAWAVENEVVAHSPIAHVRKLPERGHERYKRRGMSDDEIARFLAAAEADDEENDLRCALEGFQRVPVVPTWMTFLQTAARYGELVTLRWGDVDLARGTLLLRAENTKSKKQRLVPLMEDLVEALTQLKVLHETVLNRLPRADQHVFLSPEGQPMPWHTANLMRIFDRLLVRAGIPKVDSSGHKLDIHALRHACNSQLARRGMPLDQRQHLLGHSDPKLTSQVYTHLEVEDLRQAIENARASAEPGQKNGQAKEAR